MNQPIARKDNKDEKLAVETVHLDGVWYLFNREYHWLDRSFASEVVAEPNFGAGECAIVDADVYFDSETNTWHALAQSLSNKNVWSLNHYSRTGRSPLGRFTANLANPVIRSRSLWKSICANDPGSCPGDTGDEGTPEIMYKRNGYYFVSFHGYHSSSGTGYRGVAKTTDFMNWLTIAPDLPGGPMFTSRDCQGWNVPWNPQTGCIGGGAAASLSSLSHTYMLVEASDRNLLCTPDQNWVFGLVRSTNLARSGTWEQFGGNPLIRPAVKGVCPLQYPRLFRDGERTYLSVWNNVPGNTNMATFEIL
ncbi:MAG: hypothetical protein M3Q07_05335 [Pseudobdellovibrionaceae bacterium]|nr:hypothetical protein [Pseudobdellovibrionaceae bacterium]